MSLFSSVAKILVGGLAEKSKRVIDNGIDNAMDSGMNKFKNSSKTDNNNYCEDVSTKKYNDDNCYEDASLKRERAYEKFAELTELVKKQWGKPEFTINTPKIVYVGENFNESMQMELDRGYSNIIDYVVGNFVETDTRVYNLVMDNLYCSEDIFKVMENKIVEESDCLFFNNSPENINIKNTFNNLDISGYNMCKVVGDMDMFSGEENPEVYLNNKVNFVGYATLINGGLLTLWL